jgi:signal transduction histidine kinase
VEAERRARIAERTSRLQGDAAELVETLDATFRWPVQRVQTELRSVRRVRDAHAPVARLVELQPLLRGFFVLDGSGRRTYPAAAVQRRPSNPWPDPCGGVGGGLLGATRPPDPEAVLKAAGEAEAALSAAEESQVQAAQERVHALLTRLAERGPLESRLAGLLELGRFHDGRKAFSPASMAVAAESYAALSEHPVDLLDMRGRLAAAHGRFHLAFDDRANLDPQYRFRASALLAELQEHSLALPPDGLAQLCERTGALLEEDDPTALVRAREVAVERQLVESRYARLEEPFGRVLQAALRGGDLPRMAGGNLEGSSAAEGSGGVPFVKARTEGRFQILSYVLLEGAEGPTGLVALEVDQEVAERSFSELVARGGGRLVEGGHEPAQDEVHTRLRAPFDHLGVVLSSSAAEPGAEPGSLPRETAQLWAILLSIAGIAAGIVVTIRTVRRESKAAQLKSDFVSNVTHELKTPLTSIQMFLDTLLLGRVTDEAEAKECLEVMSRESQRLSRLIEQLLVFSRIENKKWRVRFTFAHAPELVKEAIEVLADHRHTTPDELAIEVSTIQDTPKIPVDRFAIKEALLNLLHNAVKYSPNDDRKVRVVITARRSFVEVAVEDNGMGVPRRDRRRIFVKFERGSNAEKGRIEGSGIGLTLANEIVKAHGGHIRYTALKPRGSRFSVFLPK